MSRRLRPGMVVLCVTLTSMGMLGCGEIFPDLASLENAPPGDAATVDTSSTPPKDGAPGVDSSQMKSDAGTPDSSSTVVGDGGAVYSAKSPCASSPASTVFCDDFDSEGSDFSNWTWHLVSADGGVVSLDKTQSASQNNSALVIVPGGGDGSTGAQLAKRGWSGAFVTISVAVRLSSITNISSVAALQVVSNHYGADIEFSGSGASLNAPSGVVPLPNPPVNQWFTLTMQVDADHVSVYYTTTTGTMLAGQGNNKGVPTDPPTVIFGAVYTVGTAQDAEYRVNMDNVLITSP